MYAFVIDKKNYVLKKDKATICIGTTMDRALRKQWVSAITALFSPYVNYFFSRAPVLYNVLWLVKIKSNDYKEYAISSIDTTQPLTYQLKDFENGHLTVLDFLHGYNHLLDKQLKRYLARDTK